MLTWNKSIQQYISIPGKYLYLFEEIALRKTDVTNNKRWRWHTKKIFLQNTVEKNEISGPSDANISVGRGEHGMKRKRRVSSSPSSYFAECILPNFLGTGIWGKGAECMCYSGLYYTERRGGTVEQCTNWIKLYHEKCSTGDLLTALPATLNKFCAWSG